MRISDWSSDVCSSDLYCPKVRCHHPRRGGRPSPFSVSSAPTPAGSFAGSGRDAAATSGSDAVASAASMSAFLRRGARRGFGFRSEEHTSELQSLMRISYAVSCLKKKKTDAHNPRHHRPTRLRDEKQNRSSYHKPRHKSYT